MSSPVLSVLVPTRERADTLYYTLQTLVSQDYDNLEIVVSDNASNDNTREVISCFDDPRINYFNTGKRLGMSQNWEFGLSKVTGDYVSVLGDDDGFLPNALSDVVALLTESNTQALIWQKAAYDWPGIPGVPHRLSFTSHNDLVEMNSRLILRLIANAHTSYGRLPMLYSGFVATECIKSIKGISGRFFHSITPDIYSGIVLAHAMDRYLYSLRPFSINGGSRHSNGISTQKAATMDVANRFFDETEQSVHDGISIIQGSIASYVAESFLQAFDRGLTRGISLNRKRYYRLIFRELLNTESEIKDAGLEKLKQLDIPASLARNVDKEKGVSASRHSSAVNSGAGMQTNAREFTVNCDNFPVTNIHEVSIMLGNLLGTYTPPGTVVRYSLLSLLLTATVRLINRKYPGSRSPF